MEQSSTSKILDGMDEGTKYLTPIFGSESSDAQMPRLKMNDNPVEPRIAYEMIKEYLSIEGNATQNLTTFCQTYMEPMATKIMAETMEKNAIDKTVDELIKGDVEAMKEIIENDAKKMQMLALAGMVVAITGAVAVVCGISFWDWGIVPSCIIGLLVWGIGMFMALKVERLKKEHDLVTYRELVAFTKGEPIDRDSPKSRRARKHRFLKGAALVLLSACVGAVAGYVGFMLFG